MRSSGATSMSSSQTLRSRSAGKSFTSPRATVRSDTTLSIGSSSRWRRSAAMLRSVSSSRAGIATGHSGCKRSRALVVSPSPRLRSPRASRGCRSMPSPPGAWTWYCARRRSPWNSRDSSAIPTSRAVRDPPSPAWRRNRSQPPPSTRRIRCGAFSAACARRMAWISPITSVALCGGAWRDGWRYARSTNSPTTSRCSKMMRARRVRSIRTF